VDLAAYSVNTHVMTETSLLRTMNAQGEDAKSEGKHLCLSFKGIK
jgi:hypothetical protein